MRSPTLLAVLLLAPALAGCGTPAAPPEPFERTTFLAVASFDGHRVPVTIYRPDGATAESPVPAVLHFHGWGGARETRLDAFRDFTGAGLAVASVDLRGHGEARATSQSHVASPDFEVRDAVAVVSHLANVSWVRQEAPGDPLVGAMGESYGGALPLLLAAFDSRLDALVSRDTWNDLAAAMAPGGVPKTAWFASLWLSAAVQGRLHPDVRAGFEAAVREGRLSGNASAGPDLEALLRASSPAAYAGRVAVPSLFLQGINDTLFDLGQAAANFAMVEAAGAPAALYTHLSGHGLAAGGPRAGGRHPCGDPGSLTLAWLRAHLLGGPAVAPRVCMALDDGSTLSAESYPWPGPPVGLDVPALRVQPGNLTSRDAAPAMRAEEGTAVVGAPRLFGRVGPVPGNATANANATGATVFWSLVATDGAGNARAANGQSHPQRLAAGPFSIDLAPVALRLRAGETLQLAVAAYDPLFAAPQDVAPSPVALTELRIELPVACIGACPWEVPEPSSVGDLG